MWSIQLMTNYYSLPAITSKSSKKRAKVYECGLCIAIWVHSNVNVHSGRISFVCLMPRLLFVRFSLIKSSVQILEYLLSLKRRVPLNDKDYLSFECLYTTWWINISKIALRYFLQLNIEKEQLPLGT